MEEEKKITPRVMPSIEDLNEAFKEANKKDRYGNVNTMARKKLKRKVHLFDLQTGIESDVVLEFDDLRPGDTFTLYEYSGEEVLCSGQKVMRVNSIKHKIDGSIILDVLPVVRPQFDPILN